MNNTLITPEVLKKFGAEEYQPDVYAIYLNAPDYPDRHIDVINVNDEWNFQLVQEAQFEGEDVAIISGRTIKYAQEIQDIYKAMTGDELLLKE